MGALRVVLVDDSAEVRTLVRARLRVSGGAQVVGEGNDGADAVELARRLQPDAMLLDVSMPGTDGLTALPDVLEAAPGVRVVMFSGFAEEALAARAAELGAAAYLMKSAALERVVDELLGSRSADGDPAVTRWEEHLAGEVLNQHVERFQGVFDDAAIGMATMTLQGNVVRANAALGQIASAGADALVGRSYGEVVGDPASCATVIRAVVDGGSDVLTVDHPSSTAGHLRTTMSVVRDRSGKPLYLFAQCQDVGRQRVAELELRQSERRFRLLVEAVRDYAIFMLDPDGLVASWNAGAQRTKGWTEEEIVGQHFRVFYPPDLQASGHPEHELRLALRDGVYEEEGWRVRSDGSRFWAQVTITAVHDDDGTLLGFAKVTRDHTERLRMLQQQGQSAAALAEANTLLETANAELAAAAEEQARFLAVTAHELRSPVGVLSMAGRTLGEHWTDLEEEERVDILAGMQSSATRLQRLLGDLLTTARLQASSLDLALHDVEVEPVLAAVVQRVRLSTPTAEVRLDLPPGLRVRADVGRLTQMVDNLVENALTHGRSPVTVTGRTVGDLVELAVFDAGNGVPEDLQGRLFERFATRGGSGTGLGLHIVRELARAQGGQAGYRSGDNAFVLLLAAVEEAS